MTLMRVKDLGRWSSGGTPPKDDVAAWQGDVPWLSAKDIASTKLREPTTFITEEAALAHSRVAPPGALLLIVRGMALAHGLPVVRLTERAAFNQDLRALLPRPGVDSRFAHYALIGHRWLLDRHIDRAAHGTARVTDSLFAERLPVPDLLEQRQVADFLDRECARIDALGSALKVYLASLALPALSRFAELTSSSGTLRLSHRFEIQLGKMLDEKRIDATDLKPYLRNTNVQWDRFELDDLKLMTFGAAEQRKFALLPGDLLVCEGGQPGRSAVWNGEVSDCFFQKALIRVRPRGADQSRFVMWALRLASERGDFAADGTGSTILHLPAERLAATRIPACSPAEQSTILAVVDASAAAAQRAGGRCASFRPSRVPLGSHHRSSHRSAGYRGDRRDGDGGELDRSAGERGT